MTEDKFPEGMRRALQELHDPTPVTPDERREHDLTVRRKIAKKEAIRKMQRDLLDSL